MPVDRTAAAWALSTTNEPVQVEADSEERARRRASVIFAAPRKTRGTSDRHHDLPPWDQRQLVIARVIEAPDPAIRLILAGDTAP